MKVTTEIKPESSLTAMELKHATLYVVIGIFPGAAWLIGDVVLCWHEDIISLRSLWFNRVTHGYNYRFREFGPGDKITIEG